jgi:hypothetical protein
MPEVILPCPYCGQKSHLDDGHNGNCTVYWAECNECEMCGPFVGTPEEAIAAWNALPRALHWTHEPPKVAGWYWCRECKSGVTLCVEVYGASSFLLFGSKRDDFNPQRPVTVDGIEWAGPIAPPVD